MHKQQFRAADAVTCQELYAPMDLYVLLILFALATVIF